MPTQQGSLPLLNDPVAQRLLLGAGSARLAYTDTHGSSRISPFSFWWNGAELVFEGLPTVMTSDDLCDGAEVDVTIDACELPYNALIIHGHVRVDSVSSNTSDVRGIDRVVMVPERASVLQFKPSS